MPRYLDPKNDLTFKKVFGGHKDLCISLLNAMLPLGAGRSVTSVEYQTGELPPRFDGGRNTVVDVRCEDNLGRQFIVEMQMYWADSFRQRVLLNASKAYVAQYDGRTKRGRDPYRLLKPVYELSFVNDVFEPDLADYYHHYQLVNVANTEKRIEGLELVFVELPKFRPDSRAARRLRDLWLLYLTGIGRGDADVPAALLEQPETRDAVRCLEEQSYSRQEMETYDKYLDIISVEQALLASSEEKGRTEGEAAERLRIAKGLKAAGVAGATIEAATGLAPEEIAGL
jgi:predicted transposase/invertase (TIGR01784 family)